MFKRLSKKRDREQADEESGVKAIKDMLALGGEDEVSGESDSESESEASDEEDEQDSVSGSDDDEDEDDEEGELGSDEEAASGEERVDDDEGSDAGYDTPIPISLAEVPTSPLYPYPTENGKSDSGWQVCILCPSKLLKNTDMAKVHLTSKVHVRSLARFEAFLVENPQDEDVDPRLIVDLLLDGMNEASRKAEEEAEERKMARKVKASVAKALRLEKKAAKAAEPKLTVEPTPKAVPEEKKAEGTKTEKKPKEKLSRKEKKRQRKEKLESAGKKEVETAPVPTPSEASTAPSPPRKKVKSARSSLGESAAPQDGQLKGATKKTKRKSVG